MDRRQFLHYSALAAAASTTTGCAGLTPRLARPERLTANDEKLLLVGAKAIDTVKGQLLPQTCLLIEHGKIVALLTDEQSQNVTADRTLDLNGQYLIPGLINAHCHMSLPGGLRLGLGLIQAYSRQIERHAEECVKHGVTTVRDMLAVSDMALGLKDKITRGEIIGPRMLLSCAIDIEDAYGDRSAIMRDRRFMNAVESVPDAIDSVKRAADNGVDVIKVFQQKRLMLIPALELPTMEVDMLTAITEEAARHGMVTAMHHTGMRGLDRGLAAGLTSFEHVVGDGMVNEEQLRRLADNKVTLVPTNSVAFVLAYEMPGDQYWGKGLLPEIDVWRKEALPQLIRDFCEPELVDSTIDYYHQLSDPQSYESWHLIPWPNAANFNRAAVNGYDNLMKLYEAGVTLGCGNDGGIPLVFPGALAFEMQISEKIGLLPVDILKAATVNNARLIGMQDSLGRIAEGYIADLVVTESNPLETAANLAQPSMVFQNGQLAYRS